MSPIDGPILLISEICLAHTSGVNISKAQPSKAKGLGGVAGPILRILIYLYSNSAIVIEHLASQTSHGHAWGVYGFVLAV